jgi:hypothetical protein
MDMTDEEEKEEGEGRGEGERNIGFIDGHRLLFRNGSQQRAGIVIEKG